MTRLRLVFYVLYIVLGSIIMARLLSVGFHWETLAGFVFALALIVMGFYRIRLYARMKDAQRR